MATPDRSTTGPAGAPLPRLPVRIVLVRPRNPENLGAVARALRNFDLDDWAIVALGTHDFAAARRVAVHAEELLDRPRLVATLDEALRALLLAGRFLSPRERHALGDLTAVLRRGRPSPREARLWETALRAVRRRLPPG